FRMVCPGRRQGLDQHAGSSMTRDDHDRGSHMSTRTPPLHSLEFRISYADTDPAGILYFATWFPWMERVQTEWYLLRGLRLDTLQERFGFATVTTHTEAD